MTNKTNFIANFFNWIREIIESAETPFSLFAVVILPILAPVVPAVITGIRLHSEMGLDSWLSTVTAIVLELLGYAGAITFIRSFSRWLRKETSFIKMIMYGGVYAFYVTIMYLINVRLGFLAGDSQIANQIFALLSFITIPTGLLAAEHISERSEKEEAETRRKEQKEESERLRQERRADKMEKWRTEHGANERSEQNHRTPNEHRTNSSVNGSAANKANEIRSFVRQVQDTEQRTPRVSEISKVLGVAKSYASETLKVILSEQENN